MLAYGLDLPAVTGLGVPRAALTRSWHEVTLVRNTGPAPSLTRYAADGESGVLEVAGLASLELHRAELKLRVTSPHPLADAVIAHPLLAFVGAVAARWAGRSAFHAAAVEVDSHALVLLGGPASGKSTLSSVMQAQGCAVLADDLCVVEAMTVLAGPRSADLRTEAAAQLGRGQELPHYVGRARWREVLAPAPPELGLGGFVQLGWGDRLNLSTVPAAERLGVLARHEALSLGPSGHRGFLDLLAVPMWRLTRPRAWEGLTATAELVREAAQSARPA